MCARACACVYRRGHTCHSGGHRMACCSQSSPSTMWTSGTNSGGKHPLPAKTFMSLATKIIFYMGVCYPITRLSISEMSGLRFSPWWEPQYLFVLVACQSPVPETTGSEGSHPSRAQHVFGKEFSRKAGSAGSVTFAFKWWGSILGGKRSQSVRPKAYSMLDGSLTITGPQSLHIFKMGFPHNTHCNQGWTPLLC